MQGITVTGGRKPLLKRVTNLYGLKFGRISSNDSLYKTGAAFRLKTHEEMLLIKPFNGSALQLQRISRWARALRTKGYHHIPRWRVTRSGRYWVRQNGKLFYVTDWIRGHRLTGSISELRALGAALAELHSLSGRFSIKSNRRTLRVIDQLKQKHMRFVRDMSSIERNHLFAHEWFRQHGDTCITLAAQGRETFQTTTVQEMLRKERPSLLHGDVTRPNVIVNGTKLHLVDWDSVKIGSSLFELTKALANTTDFSPVLMSAFLQGYVSKCPLFSEQRKVIAALFRWPREAWYVAKSSAMGGTPQGLFSILRDSWADRLVAIEWLDTWAEERR